jgi:CarD family transcriptional regulator
VIDAKGSREAPAAATPQSAPAIAKAGAPTLAKRAPVATKAPKAGAPETAPEREEEGAAPKSAKAPGQRQGFKLNEFVVYPAHGVGQIVAVEDQEVAGFRLELFVINFAKDKMTLRVPTSKVTGVGMRKLSEPDVARRSLEILTGRARIKRTMWSRRAQEYEAKINSGDLISIAEVVRDLYRSDAQPEQSYSERQLYEAALDRMAREVVIVQKLTETETLKAIEAQLQKGPRRGKVEEIDADDAEADIEEAA